MKHEQFTAQSYPGLTHSVMPWAQPLLNAELAGDQVAMER